MRKSDELNRLKFGGIIDQPEGFIVEILVSCSGNAPLVLERTKEILNRVIDAELSFDDSINDWKAVLPDWFVNTCSPEMSRQEVEILLKNSHGFEDLASIWSLSNFLEWFRPEERSWYWWDGVINNPDTLIVQIIVEGDPFAWGALRFLLKASGANESEEL